LPGRTVAADRVEGSPLSLVTIPSVSAFNLTGFRREIDTEARRQERISELERQAWLGTWAALRWRLFARRMCPAPPKLGLFAPGQREG